jgi:3-isopropylmalate dehydratase small subunit
MAEFTTLTSTAVPLRAENVDTDQIIPAKYLTAISKAGIQRCANPLGWHEFWQRLEP